MGSRGRMELRAAGRLAVLLVTAGLVAAGCSGGQQGTGGGAANQAPDPPSSAPQEPASITLSPREGASGVQPGKPVTVSVDNGTVTDVRLVGPDGTEVEGALQEEGAGWVSTAELGYGKSYTLTATATGESGKTVTAESAFTTARPDGQVAMWTNLGDGQTVGAGMPLIFTFSQAIGDRGAAEHALRISAEPDTRGAFRWVSDRRVIWRPEEYWQPGTEVTVNGEIYGIDLGNGVYGNQDNSIEFTVGDKVVAVADGASHQMKVMVNDKLVRTIPISMGKPSSPTPSGVYTVMAEHNGFVMDSSTYGVPVDAAQGYKISVDYAVRMSNSGIFYHSAPWSVGAQGSRNVSHGCINMTTANAKWLMDLSQPGDIIKVVNSGGRQLEPTDGWSVWQLPWEEWTRNT